MRRSCGPRLKGDVGGVSCAAFDSLRQQLDPVLDARGRRFYEDLEPVTIDTTVQLKAINFQTDAKLLHAAIRPGQAVQPRQALRQQPLQPVAEPLAPMAKVATLVREDVPGELFATEELEIRGVAPALAHSLIGQPVNVLEQQQLSRRCRSIGFSSIKAISVLP
ncbi:hypothetical protein SAMN05216338_108321 [Bradyrhizobium sp. Rc2d]|nr:hypothetical protein SAMN05216338_108321 [Bradyrhizobium sp. Rc2d]